MGDDSRDLICDMCGVRLHPEGWESSRPNTYALDMKGYHQLLEELAGLERAYERSAGQALPGRLRFLRSALLPLKSVAEAHRASCGLPEDLVGLPFGARKVGAFALSKPFFTPPLEIARITRGAYVELIGLFVNDGHGLWNGFDVDSGMGVRVQRFSGRLISSAPEILLPTESRFRRDASTERCEAVEVVTTRQLSERQLAELVQMANVLWCSRASFLAMVTDTHNQLFLRDGPEGKSFGGPGRLNGPAGRLADLLDSMLR